MGDSLNLMNGLGFIVVMLGVVLYKILFHMKRMERKFSYSTGDLVDDDLSLFDDDEMSEQDDGILLHQPSAHRLEKSADGNVGLTVRNKKTEYSRVTSMGDDETEKNQQISSLII
jgi:hypothetical protein